MMNKKVVSFVMLAFFAAACLVVFRSCAAKRIPTAPGVAKKAQIKQIRWAKPSQAPIVPETVSKGKMAIILDDWGSNYSLLKTVIELKRPLTLAVIPNLPRSRKIAEEAHMNGLGVIIHMPMQPIKNGEPIEPHTIMVKDTDEMILRYLEEAVEGVPYAEGMNNHMGSLATADSRVMRIVLRYLKERGLFFVDSQVVRYSAGPWIARELKMPYTLRDVFIDNELNTDVIEKQIKKAERMALKRGKAIVIGHDYRKTVEAIRSLIPELEKEGIQLVHVSDLLEHPESPQYRKTALQKAQ